MFSRMSIIRSTGNYSDKIEKLRDAFDAADAVVIGAGAYPYKIFESFDG